MKVVKHVRVQSPPPRSPDDVVRPTFNNIQIPQGLDEHFDHVNDRFDSATRNDSSSILDAESLPRIEGKEGGAPRNPFSKTLATLEGTEGQDFHNDASVSGPGKPTMDVEAFRRLLMTGSSGTTTPSAMTGTTAQPQPISQLMLNDGSSTEASSISRHSIFENIQDNHLESPRTSQEAADADDERGKIPGLRRSASEKKKPPPPSSRHGKLINMQLKEEPSAQSLYSPVASSPAPLTPLTPSSTTESIASFATQRSNVNKPLPPAPARRSHDSARESIFDKEAAGKTPEPPSPPSRSNSVARKAAPPPPAGRRHGLPVSESPVPQVGSSRMSSPGGDSREASIHGMPFSHTAGQAGSIKVPSGLPKAPPPPPVRRHGSVRNVSPMSLQLPSSGEVVSQSGPSLSPPSTNSPLPPPPPQRAPSVRHAARPPSVVSMDSTVSSRRTSHPPPPPPPHRQRSDRGSKGNSLDLPRSTPASTYSPGSGRSDDYFGETDASKVTEEEDAEQLHSQEQGKEEEESARHDILADITKLQSEIDALRQHRA